MQDILPAIKCHHRRFDGKGYPDDCPLEEVPLAARIIEVADAFDAMTTDRPYRQALTPENAYAEFKKHSGKQFDPQVVKAFLDSEVDLLEDIQTERIAGFPNSFSIPGQGYPG
jgi:HD-GYP domain-containing protein (c-di-GMP phosphodiesterase class II)